MKTTRLMALLLCGHFALTASGAAPPQGRVVWWGEDFFEARPDQRNPNGVLESGNEILTNVVAIAAGPAQILALKSDGIVLSFGRSMYGGNNVPPGLSNVVSIAVEGSSCWAIKVDGTVARWGSDEDPSNLVSSLSNITAVAYAGYRGYLALKTDGTVLGFNFDDGGVPADRPTAPAVGPITVRGQVLSNVVALASWGNNPMVLTSDGKVLTLGYEMPAAPVKQPRNVFDENWAGPRVGGQGTDYESAGPLRRNGEILSNVVAFAALPLMANVDADGNIVNLTRTAVLALKSSGTVVELEPGDTGEAAMLAGLSNVVAVSATEQMRLALKRDGTVVQWGSGGPNQSLPPDGLSNVVAIAAGDAYGIPFGLALTTGPLPPSVHIRPHGRLEEMAAKADLIFKGQVISSAPFTNSAFDIASMEVQATRMKVISVLHGTVPGNEIVFEHYLHEPNGGGWSGGHWPAFYPLEPGQTCLVIAAKMDRPDVYYIPPTNSASPPEVFRQIADFPKHDEDGLTRTLDARPLPALKIKDAVWQELNLMLHDTNPSNSYYAIERLDDFSLAGRRNDEWTRSDDFKREVVLDALLPFVTNSNERVANRAIDCFAVIAGTASMKPAYHEQLAKIANGAPSPWTRYAAIRSLSGREADATTNALARLLHDPDEDVVICSVTLLPQIPPSFSEPALRELANEPSPYVRSVVAKTIGDGKFSGLVPTLAKLFADSAGAVPPLKGLPFEAVRPNFKNDSTGDVHACAGDALLAFDVEEVTNILKSNLNDTAFHIPFIAKLAEKNAEQWLPELTNIIQTRINYVNDMTKLAPTDPKRYSDPTGTWIFTGAYADCWNDLCHYLLSLPRDKFAGGEQDRYMGLLERAGMSTAGVLNPPDHQLYELYQTQGLQDRVARLRQNRADDKWWFDDFDEHHPELKSTAK